MRPEREASYIPGESVAWCERCERWTRHGQPYVMVAPGRFTHRVCVVPDPPVPGSSDRTEGKP